ncbi:MAG TPA: hypothetical protein VJ650_01895 [Gemmatimonadaceae bacterium]|nr:hypothetical protein [Gemmatimonadaceae bacterium]
MRRTLLGRSLGALLMSAMLAPAAAQAQYTSFDEPRGPSRAFAGIHLMVAQPLGEFDDYIDWGGGIGGEFLYAFDRQGAVGLRANLGIMIYGHETKRVPLSETLGRIRVDVNTSNNIFVFGIGPQVMLPSGVVRPYLNGTVGLSYFFTRSSVEGSADLEPFASSTNFDDATFAWAAGGGLYIPLRKGHKNPLSLDIGAQYHANGEARYLREGSIQEDDAGNVFIDPIRSQTNLVTYRLGITVGL